MIVFLATSTFSRLIGLCRQASRAANPEPLPRLEPESSSVAPAVDRPKAKKKKTKKPQDTVTAPRIAVDKPVPVAVTPSETMAPPAIVPPKKPKASTATTPNAAASSTKVAANVRPTGTGNDATAPPAVKRVPKRKADAATALPAAKRAHKRKADDDDETRQRPRKRPVEEPSEKNKADMFALANDLQPSGPVVSVTFGFQCPNELTLPSNSVSSASP